MTRSFPAAALLVAALIAPALSAPLERGAGPVIVEPPRHGAVQVAGDALVHCLLPPRLTRLGGSSVTLAPSRVAELDPRSCRQRGGRLLGPSA